MGRWVALLRAINVSGKSIISMEQLRQVASNAGFQNASTVLQTGNLVFDYDKQTRADTLEQQLEKALESGLNLNTQVIVRSAEDVMKAVEDNPFPAEARENPSKLLLYFLKGTVDGESATKLNAAIKGPEAVSLRDHRTLYVFYRDGIGRSKLTTSLIEKQLGVSCTGRNWNTVLKIHAKCASK